MRKLLTAAVLSIGLTFFATASFAAGAQAKFIKTDSAAGLSKAVVVEKVPLVHTTQFFARPGGNVDVQVKSLFKQIAIALDTAHSSFRDVVKLNVYATSPEVVAEVKKILAKKLKTPPAVTYVCGNLPQKDVKVAMDAIAISHDQVTEVKRLPEACILPASGVVYISGQADKSELLEATQKTLEKLEETLKFLNLTKADVVECRSFMQPIERMEEVRAVFQKFFGKDCPPLSFIDWRSKDPVIEIEMVAASKPANNEPMEFLTQPGATTSPVYSKIVRVNAGKLIYVSGLYGKSATNAVEEVNEIFGELGEIVKAAGSDMTHLAKAMYFVSNNEASNKLNELRPKFYDPKRPPAASKGLVPSVEMKDRGLTLDMIAVTVEK